MWQPQGIYSEYVLRSPVLLVGDEAINGLYNYPANRVAIIHGKSFNDIELIKKIFKKKEVKLIERSWIKEPDLIGIRAALQEIEIFQPDTIIAVGGGSVIDGTKLCRLFYEIPYFSPKDTKLSGNSLKTNFIVIPTTVGTGAEVSSSAVYIENGRKEVIVLHELQPDVVVYDKRYVNKIPCKILIASIMDAMSHVVEGYISKIHNTVIEIQAGEALRLIVNELNNYKNDRPIDFSRLQYAGFLGGIIQNHCIVGACHAVAHQLASLGFSHGEGISLLLPAVIKVNSLDLILLERYQSLCKDATLNSVQELICLIDDVCSKSGINSRKNEIKEILYRYENDDNFMNNIKSDRGGKGNPIEISDEYIKQLIRSI